MRLLVITNLFHPDRGGGASVFSDLCFGLAERGWEVTVLTTHPYYPEWKRKAPASVWRSSREDIRGVKVIRHWMYVPTRPSALGPRLLYESSFLLSLCRSLLAFRADATMVYCPLLGAVGFAALRKFVHGGPLWLNVQDIPADAASASGISKSKGFDAVAQWFQRILFNAADQWSTISPIMASRLAELRAGDQPIHICPNWLNESMAVQVEAVPGKQGRTPGRPVRLLYAGNIGKKQGLLETLQALQRAGQSLEVMVHGDGGEARNVRAWIEASGDSRFRFGPFLDEVGFVAALHECDAFLISERAGSGASFIPSKLIPCLATGTPVVAVCDAEGPLGVELEGHGLGLRVGWSEIEGLAKRVAELAADSDRFAAIQGRCLERSKVYRREHAVGRFAELLEKMVVDRN